MNNNTDIVILAGGLGTRLREVVSNIPKSMAMIAGKPFLEYQLMMLQKYGFKRIILSTGYLADSIEHYFGNNFMDIRIEYSAEKEPLGTGGAIKYAFNRIETETFMILNGDSMFNIDLNEFLKWHNIKKADVSMALQYAEEASRYGNIEIDGDIIREFKEKNNIKKSGLINAGIYIFNTSNVVFDQFPLKFSIEKEYFPYILRTQKCLGKVFDGYFIDIGIPIDYERAQNEFKKLESR